MAKQIFIGGTGRSGTTVLYRLLQSHKDIFAFESEMRFIIDYHGIINLIDALTNNYSPVQAREAFFHFEKLMKDHLTHKYSPPYIGFEFEKSFGKDFYQSRVDQFLNKLVTGSFYGSDYPVSGNCIETRMAYFIRKLEKYYTKYVKNRSKDNLWPYREMKNIKFFSDRQELCDLAQSLVDELFMNVAHKNNCSAWCEKTPSNILHLDFLYEMFPQSHFIHIKRHPIGVIQSMQNQFWADPDIEGICLSMKQVYNKWFNVRKKLDFTKHNYMEIKLEDLSANPDQMTNEITSFLGIDSNFDNPPILKSDNANYWERTMSIKDKEIVKNILKDEIEIMGY